MSGPGPQQLLGHSCARKGHVLNLFLIDSQTGFEGSFIHVLLDLQKMAHHFCPLSIMPGWGGVEGGGGGLESCRERSALLLTRPRLPKGLNVAWRWGE